MNARLAALIREYQDRVQEAVSLFSTCKGINPVDWRQNNLPQVGFIDAEHTIKYFFHGIGCYVNLPSGPVDWDFGYGDRHEGFDAWRLWKFAKDGTANFPEFVEKEVLDKAFEEAKTRGTVKALYIAHQDYLYYIVE